MEGFEVFTFEILATPAGAAFFTFLFVAYTKRRADKWNWVKTWGTDIFAALIGFLTIAIASIVVTIDGGLPETWLLRFWLMGKIIILAFFNGFISAMIAGKMNDKAISGSIKEE